MSWTDHLSLSDRRAYGNRYATLAKIRRAYDACGDTKGSRRVRNEISNLTAHYVLRSKTRQSNVAQHSFAYQRSNTLAKEPQMITVTNSSDDSRYIANGRAVINLSHMLSKDQMLFVARLAMEFCPSDVADIIVGRDTDRDIKASTLMRLALSNVGIVQRIPPNDIINEIIDYNPSLVAKLLSERSPNHSPLSGLNQPSHYVNVRVGGTNLMPSYSLQPAQHKTIGEAHVEAERISLDRNNEVRTYAHVSTTTVKTIVNRVP